MVFLEWSRDFLTLIYKGIITYHYYCRYFFRMVCSFKRITVSILKDSNISRSLSYVQNRNENDRNDIRALMKTCQSHLPDSDRRDTILLTGESVLSIYLEGYQHLILWQGDTHRLPKELVYTQHPTNHIFCEWRRNTRIHAQHDRMIKMTKEFLSCIRQTAKIRVWLFVFTSTGKYAEAIGSTCNGGTSFTVRRQMLFSTKHQSIYIS